MGLELIDGTLHLLGENDEVLHVFERARGTLGPAAYKHMCDCAIANFSSELKPEELWERAEASWNDLTPETQGLLIALQAKEEQMVKDIRTGLLATLLGYQGINSIKDRFAEAIRSIE
jgi:hypothetical protein